MLYLSPFRRRNIKPFFFGKEPNELQIGKTCNAKYPLNAANKGFSAMLASE